MRETKKAKDSAQAAKITAALNGVQSVSLNVTAKFSHFGEDFQVAKPSGTIKPIGDLTRMMGGLHGGQTGTTSGSEG